MNNRGQIAIIALFALSIFAVVGGSVIHQIIFEQRKAALEEKSKQAYYAADSGIEKALLEIIDNNNDNYQGEYAVGSAEVNVSTSAQAGGSNYVLPFELYAGQNIFLNLKEYSSSTNKLRVCWNKMRGSLITMYFYRSSGNVRVSTNVINATSPNVSGTGVLVAAKGINECGVDGDVYYSDLVLPAGEPDYLVVWPAYEGGVRLAFGGQGGGVMPSQGTIISSSGVVKEGNDNVKREVNYFVSKVDNNELNYPPNYLLVPIYAVGGVSY